MIPAIIIVLLVVALLAFAFCGEPSGRNESLDHNASVGRWRVLYNDGRLSQPFCRDVAEDYAAMFGGRVVPREFKP